MVHQFLVFHIIKDLIYIILSVLLIIEFFYIMSDVKEIKELKIKTNFLQNNKNNKNYQILNIFENYIDDNEINKFEEFFNNYGLKEGQTFNDNEDIKNSLDNYYRTSLAIIILLIIFILPSIVPFIFICLIHRDEEGVSKEILECLSIYTAFIRVIIIFILFWIYFGFFISYKFEFEYDFLDFYDNISGNSLQTSFKNYYNIIFDLKSHSLFNVILLPAKVLFCVSCIIFYYDPCNCYKEKCYD